MSYSGGIVSKPVTMTDIAQAVAGSSRDLGYLIKNAGDNNRINRFAKYKPICDSSVVLDRNSQWWKTSDGMCGLVIPKLGSFDRDYRRCAKEWDYHYPGWNGANVYPYRMLDFDGYNANAQSVFEIKLSINGTQLNDYDTQVITLAKNVNTITFGITVPSATSDARTLNFNDLKFYVADYGGYWVDFRDMTVMLTIIRQEDIDGVVEIPRYASDRVPLRDIVGTTYTISHNINEAMLKNTDLYATVALIYDGVWGGYHFPMHKAVRLQFRIAQGTDTYGQVATFSMGWHPVYGSSTIQLTNGYADSRTARVVYLLDYNSLNPHTLADFTVTVPAMSSISERVTLSDPMSQYGDPWIIDCLVYWEGSSYSYGAGWVNSNGEHS